MQINMWRHLPPHVSQNPVGNTDNAIWKLLKKIIFTNDIMCFIILVLIVGIWKGELTWNCFLVALSQVYKVTQPGVELFHNILRRGISNRGNG